MAGNPFTYGNPISDPRRFFGRTREVDQICDRLRNQEFESSSLAGDRRIGKTSLLNYLRPWSECHVDVTRSDDHPRPRRCPPCHDHAGDIAQANQDHIEMWRALARSRKRDHERVEAQLQARITDLEQELHDRPTRAVHHWVDQDELEEARKEAQRAFRSREYAWQALCEIRLLHREGQPGQCRCGQRLDRCKIAQIVEHYPALEKWEKEQLSRLRGGFEHNLPDGHPAVLDRNWQPLTDESVDCPYVFHSQA